MIILIAILLAFLGIAAGAASRDDVKNDFEQFFTQQTRLNSTYYPTYKKQGLLTFALIVKQNTIQIEEIMKEKKALYDLPPNSTVENNEKLARIANRIARENYFYVSITDDKTLSKNLKFYAFIRAVNDAYKRENLKKSVKAVIEAESPINGIVEPAYQTLYETQYYIFVPSYLRIQAQMEIVRLYYKRPEVGLSNETIARIDEILADNMEAEKKILENFALDSYYRVEMMLKVLPAYLKSNKDLFQELNLAQIECNFVRCRSTKDDHPVVSTDKPTDKITEKPTDEPTEKPTDEPNDELIDKLTEKPTDKPRMKSAQSRTSGSIFAAICATVLFIAFL